MPPTTIESLERDLEVAALPFSRRSSSFFSSSSFQMWIDWIGHRLYIHASSLSFCVHAKTTTECSRSSARRFSNGCRQMPRTRRRRLARDAARSPWKTDDDVDGETEDNGFGDTSDATKTSAERVRASRTASSILKRVAKRTLSAARDIVQKMKEKRKGLFAVNAEEEEEEEEEVEEDVEAEEYPQLLLDELAKSVALVNQASLMVRIPNDSESGGFTLPLSSTTSRVLSFCAK